MYSKIAVIVFALAASPLVSAHGKIAVVTGDKGGNGTALGIQGGVIPGMGPNYETEPDTTVFWSKEINTDQDIGFTESGAGNNELTDLSSAMALSGSTLPQVSSGGSVSGTFHVVTSDGCGPLEAVIDDTATAQFSTAPQATVTSDVPGTEGNCPTDLSNDSGNSKLRRSLRRALVKMGLLSKRAENVDKNYSFSVAIPAGTQCTGTINGISGLCLVKVSNNNENGPFGGVVVVQMSNATTKARARDGPAGRAKHIMF